MLAPSGRCLATIGLSLASVFWGQAAQAAPTCQIDTPPAKTAAQLLKERLVWGSWNKLDERTVRIDSAAQPTPTYHLLMKRPGATANTGKPLVVFLHGYPEFAWSWENWLDQIGSHHDAIAIDLKGYGESSKPTELAPYDFKRVVDEIDDIATCLGYSQVIPVGHDWGGTFAWLYSLYHPDRTKALVVLSTPHPYTFYRELAKLDSEQRQRSHYMELIRENTPRSMLEYYAGQAKETSLFGPFYQWPRVNRLLLANMDSLWKWNRMFSYYRVMDFPPNPTDYPEVPSAHSLATFTVRAPTLAFFGKADPYFSAESWRGVQQFVPRLDFRQIEGAGHFINHDVPEMPQQVLEFIDTHTR